MTRPEIIPIEGEPWRFYVESESEPEFPRLVDLEEYDGVGWCSCPHFTFRCQPNLERGDRGTELRCKHILAAREYLIDQQIHRERRRKSA